MAWLADKEFWVALIGYASIASVAVFGLFGAYAKTRGKPGTAAEARSTGRLELVSILAIIFSAVFAMSSAILRSWIDDEKAARQAASTAIDDAEQRLRFSTQLATLYRLNVRMIQANADSRETLDKQDRLLRDAQRSMLMTAGLTAQEQENTGRVLHGMWDDANRINPSSLVVRVAYSCGPVHGDFPRLMDEGATMSLRVARLTKRQFAGLSRMAFSTSLLVSGAFGSTLQSAEQHITISRAVTPGGDQVEQVARFTSFHPRIRGAVSDRGLGRFSDPANWRGAVVEVTISTFESDLVARAAAALRQPLEPVTRYYRMLPVPHAGARSTSLLPMPHADEQSMSMLSCPVRMTLIVSGRSVATAEGRLVRVQERQGDARGLVVVKFPVVDVDATALPVFGIAAPHRRAAR